ncbi:MAG: YdiU family protein [bacterium]
MPIDAIYLPDPRFPSLGEAFFDPVAAARFPARQLRFRNQAWAARVGLGGLSDDDWSRHFWAFEPLPGNLERPLALRYHGHQFQVYNPQLGDGRGFLFAQLRDPVDQRLLDLGTKGSGQTPWSRGGDGRLTLKGGVREILATEMLEALGVYTSKTFSLFETGEALERGDEPSPTRSSVMVRLSHGHVRFGSFQRQAYLRDTARLGMLLEFAASHYLPEVSAAGANELAPAFLRAVSERAARLAASWMVAGFVHGVLNTDNLNITGESFDYGPWRFLPRYDPAFTAAYFDSMGLYAYGRQPAVVLWNLEQLAVALAPLATVERLEEALSTYEVVFRTEYRRRFRERLGVDSRGDEADTSLVRAALGFLGESYVGFDRFFFDWYGGAASAARALGGSAARHYTGPRYEEFRALLDRHAPSHPERLAGEYFRRDQPCSMLIQEVESLWDAIAERDDWGPLEAKIAEVRAMGAALGHPVAGGDARVESRA